ncbi:nitroreductase family protein [Streptomyces sp. AC627_RSS907]|uniref:nitroreductase family protein n=1 Tax=Streptomyces sp. AC627_RSS907 TaxID=2823684 RepID=UPI001C23361D|nr:nitroreductase family protein [Streptomyces sp. AC627_RSS907]
MSERCVTQPDGLDCETLRTLRTRHVVRQYLPDEIEDATLDLLMEAALAAPSASNKQAWAFVAVREPRLVRLVQAFSPGIIGTPPLIVAACFDRSRAARPAQDHQSWDVGLLCVAMAVENLLLAAHALGLGGCPVASFHAKAVGRLLELPAHLQTLLVVPVGRPARTTTQARRRNHSEVIRHDRWR